MKLVALKDFSYTHYGYDRREYQKDQVIETDDLEMAEVAYREKWAKPVKNGVKPAENAPETGPSIQGEAPEAKNKGSDQPAGGNTADGQQEQ